MCASSYEELSKQLKHLKRLLFLKKEKIMQNDNYKKYRIQSVLASILTLSPHSPRVVEYSRYKGELSMSSIIYFPSIDLFKRKHLNSSINVSGHEVKNVFPLRITYKKERQRQMNPLQLIGQNENAHRLESFSQKAAFQAST